MGKSQVLRTVKDIDAAGKRLLVRLDVDVPITEVEGQRSEIGVSDVGIADETRLVNTLPTIRYLLDKQSKITIIGHLGKPHGKVVEELKIEPVREWFERRFPGAGIEIRENLRFDIGEETNSQAFAKEIVRRSGAQIYVFEAFATAHQSHASVISIPKLAPETVVGFRFFEEVQNLAKIWQNPKQPVVFVLGGAKLSTKLPLVEKLVEAADMVLLGGVFPVQSSKLKVKSCGSKLKIAELCKNGMDISEKSAREFAEIIMNAGTAVWNGPMGQFEDSINALTDQRINLPRRQTGEFTLRNTPAWGTYVVAKAIKETKAYTLVGGGDTEAALTKFGGSEGIDWVSSGGGAMLYYLAYRTLPFLEAIK